MQTSVPFRASLGIVAFAGAAIAALAATHPAQAASVLANVTSAVSCATTTACVSGTNTSNGPGVEGTSKSSYGVEGVSTSNDGLKGISSTSNGISGSSTSSKTTAYGVKGASPYIGVFGESPTSYNDTIGNGIGVYGTAPTLGVVGSESSNGSDGFAAGVIGLTPSGASNAVGVYGVSNDVGVVKGSSTGVEGQTDGGIGVYGLSDSGDGVQGQSYSSNGIEGDSTNNYGAFAYSGSGDAALGATSASGGGAVITGGTFGLSVAGATNKYQLVTGPTQAESFMVDAPGNVYYAGSLIAFSNSSSGAKVRTFGPKSATPTVEDTESAQLVSGLATVRLDPTFASSIDPHVAYRVFLTPDGDTRGLYVATKTPAGFIVRETQGGRSTLAFDYRIVATTLGAVGQRMSVATDSLLPRADSLLLAKIRARSRPATHGAPTTEAAFRRTPFGR